jgi:hypothetical protein
MVCGTNVERANPCWSGVSGFFVQHLFYTFFGSKWRKRLKHNGFSAAKPLRMVCGRFKGIHLQLRAVKKTYFCVPKTTSKSVPSTDAFGVRSSLARIQTTVDLKAAVHPRPRGQPGTSPSGLAPRLTTGPLATWGLRRDSLRSP